MTIAAKRREDITVQRQHLPTSIIDNRDNGSDYCLSSTLWVTILRKHDDPRRMTRPCLGQIQSHCLYQVSMLLYSTRVSYRRSTSAVEIITENSSPVGKSETFVEQSKSNDKPSTNDCIDQVDMELLFPSSNDELMKFTLVQVWF